MTRTKLIAYSALMCALLIVSTLWFKFNIPGTGVLFTTQVLFVLLCGQILPPAACLAAIGAYLALVGDAQAVIFTDTIGETVPEVREAVCSGMDPFGIALDPQRNASAQPLPVDVATPRSPVRVWAVRTNEEISIARSVYQVSCES